ncbi:hypothetical protein B0H19DRAFT_1132173 [Mycena capillaripes]|nr:hypothetical protein B0H19DRAFT_1132173 [Mycena capillaripes]
MSYPWLAQTAHNKAAVSEGLKIVRKVIARDAVKTGLSTTDLYKLAIREPPPPTFALTILSQDDDFAPEIKYGKTGRRRIPPPAPPHPRHPVRSLSFLKHHILPIIEGERYVRHVREKRLVVQSKTDMKSRHVRGQKQQAAMDTPATPLEATVWVWQASKPPLHVQKHTPAPPPVLYDCSHMKASKRKAHKERLELAAKRAVLRARREKLRAEARRKAEMPILAEKRAESRARHEAAEKAGWAEKERRKKLWMEQNPGLAKTLTKQQAGADQKLGAKRGASAPSKKLRAA